MSHYTEEEIKSAEVTRTSLLTERQLEILKEFRDGSTVNEVASRLGLAPRTITVHKYNAFKRIGARNIIEALNFINKYHKKG